jgi:hypothetical protein
MPAGCSTFTLQRLLPRHDVTAIALKITQIHLNYLDEVTRQR